MPAIFECVKSLSHHAEGTKFYQIYAMRSPNSARSILITHWGKEMPDHKPKLGGQTKVKHFTATSSADAERRTLEIEKGKRDYRHFAQKGYSFDNKAEVVKFLNEHFYSPDAVAYTEYLLGPGVASVEAICDDPDEEPKKKAPKAVPIEPVAKPESWGTW